MSTQYFLYLTYYETSKPTLRFHSKQCFVDMSETETTRCIHHIEMYTIQYNCISIKNEVMCRDCTLHVAFIIKKEI